MRNRDLVLALREICLQDRELDDVGLLKASG